MFTQFQYSSSSAIPPSQLRHALARAFADQRRYQLGRMDDAAECFVRAANLCHLIIIIITVHYVIPGGSEHLKNARCNIIGVHPRGYN